tara:strand:+ start:1638 stop:2360 length:723 start_codon:yes stop_codon:yes gene_type:complete
MKILAVIPARYKSSRFPGKPLAKIKGKEMIIRVVENCEKALNKKNIVVATDNKKIFNTIKKFQYSSIMTSKKCKTGTDRVAEVAKKIKAKIYLNIQGDEPLLKNQHIKKVISKKIKYPNHVVCAYSEIKNLLDLENDSIPKVVIGKKNQLIYISRSKVPNSNKNIIANKKYYKQVCIYAFNSKELSSYKKYGKKSKIEKLEDIEIIRFLELGIPIKMVKVSSNTIAVDYKSDIKKVEKIL